MLDSGAEWSNDHSMVSGRRTYLDHASGIVLLLLLCLSVSAAAGDANSSGGKPGVTLTTKPSKDAAKSSSQVASLPSAGSAPSSSAPLVLSIDPFKAALASTAPQAVTLTPPEAPLAAIGSGSGGAEFVPMLKKTDTTNELNNRAGFFENHEFGIALVSKF